MPQIDYTLELELRVSPEQYEFLRGTRNGDKLRKTEVFNRDKWETQYSTRTYEYVCDFVPETLEPSV